MPIFKDGDDYIPFFQIGKKKVKIYAHDEGDGSYSFTSVVADGDKFSSKVAARTFMDAIRAWFETL